MLSSIKSIHKHQLLELTEEFTVEMALFVKELHLHLQPEVGVSIRQIQVLLMLYPTFKVSRTTAKIPEEFNPGQGFCGPAVLYSAWHRGQKTGAELILKPNPNKKQIAAHRQRIVDYISDRLEDTNIDSEIQACFNVVINADQRQDGPGIPVNYYMDDWIITGFEKEASKSLWIQSTDGLEVLFAGTFTDRKLSFTYDELCHSGVSTNIRNRGNHYVITQAVGIEDVNRLLEIMATAIFLALGGIIKSKTVASKQHSGISLTASLTKQSTIALGMGSAKVVSLTQVETIIIDSDQETEPELLEHTPSIATTSNLNPNPPRMHQHGKRYSSDVTGDGSCTSQSHKQITREDCDALEVGDVLIEKIIINSDQESEPALPAHTTSVPTSINPPRLRHHGKAFSSDVTGDGSGNMQGQGQPILVNCYADTDIEDAVIGSHPAKRLDPGSADLTRPTCTVNGVHRRRVFVKGKEYSSDVTGDGTQA
jgi:hypothetical protein